MGWTWHNYRIEFEATDEKQVYVKLFYAQSETVARKQFAKLFPQYKIKRVAVDK
jgi:hypothetical protein